MKNRKMKNRKRFLFTFGYLLLLFCLLTSDCSVSIMLTHIVVWKYRADVEQAIREEHVARLRRLSFLIPEIQSFSVGFDTLHLARSYDTGLVAVFRDRASLDAYTIHPEHIIAADFGRNISEHVASVDFEGEG